MRPLVRNGLVVLVAIGLLGGLGLFAASPDETGICAHLFELGAQAGHTAEAAEVTDEQCREEMSRRRGQMGLVRRTEYGWCVTAAKSLDEFGRC